jgi:hypothetical protein
MRAFLLSGVGLAGALPLSACCQSPGCRAVTGGAPTVPDAASAGPSPVCN